jgi:LuxR family maltose regulon positive regulatory protein
VLDEVDAIWQNMYHAGPLQILQCWRVLLSGEAARITDMIAALENSDEWLAHAHLFYSPELLQMLKARLLIAQGQFEPACALLEEIAETTQAGGRTGLLIQALAVQAGVLHRLGRAAEARSTLERALTLAEPGGYVRVFVDEGLPLAKLLFGIADGIAGAEGTPSGALPGLKGYAARLLDAFPRRISSGETDQPAKSAVPTPAHPAQPDPAGLIEPELQSVKNMLVESEHQPAKNTLVDAQALTEPLSQRELEVLRLLAEGLSNNQIAMRLVITPGTVKVHTNKIYAKLDVNSRTAAVAKARGLGIV